MEIVGQTSIQIRLNTTIQHIEIPSLNTEPR